MVPALTIHRRCRARCATLPAPGQAAAMSRRWTIAATTATLSVARGAVAKQTKVMSKRHGAPVYATLALATLLEGWLRFGAAGVPQTAAMAPNS